MTNQTVNTYALIGYDVTVYTHGENKPHFWLTLDDGTSMPLSTSYDPDGGAYCYMTTTAGAYKEYRLYSTGETVLV